jgi:hypothetical protein
MLRQYQDGIDPRLFVFSRSGSIEEANPAMGGPLGSTLADIEQARVRLPTWHWRRLYLNLPGQGAGSAFDAIVIESSVVTGRKVLPPQPGIVYKFGVDLSGGGDDDATLGVAHCDAQGRLVLDLVTDQGPRITKTFSPELAVSKFADIIKLYGGHSVVGDAYAGQWGRDAFRKHGIEYVVSDKNRSEIYASFEVLLNAGLVDLLDIPKMTSQFIGLIRRGVKIDHSGSGSHDDWSNSAALALVMAQTNQWTCPVFVL